MDFTINQPEINISQEEDTLYKEAYLKILKSEIIMTWMKMVFLNLGSKALVILTS